MGQRTEEALRSPAAPPWFDAAWTKVKLAGAEGRNIGVRVVIVGAGIGGLTLALALHARGLRPVILERSRGLEAIGAGVQLGPNATRILNGLGLEAALAAMAFAPRAAQVRDGRNGRLRLHLPLGRAAVERWGAPYLQVHRGDLQSLLLAAVRDREAADLWLGVEVERLERGGVALRAGDRVPADLVVGCDGVHSQIRSGVAGASPARPSGEIAWRALIPTGRLAALPQVAGVWTWPRRHLVAYPVRDGAAVNLVAVTPGSIAGDGWSEPGESDALRAAFADAEPTARALLAAVESTARWSVAELDPLPAWVGAGAALLGDAAHPLRPYLAQGAAMAIEDAEALARRLSEPGDLPARLRAYEVERKPRATRVQAASRRNGAIFHLPGALSALAFGAAGAIDATRGGAMSRLDWLYGYRSPA